MELELRFGRNLNLITLLDNGERASRDRSDRCAHAGVAGNGPDRGAETSTPKQTTKRPTRGTFSFRIKNIGVNRNRDSADHDLRKLQL
jgi:hypothetical protein